MNKHYHILYFDFVFQLPSTIIVIIVITVLIRRMLYLNPMNIQGEVS